MVNSASAATVVGAAPAPEGETLPEWYQITATWAREMFRGNETRAPRCCLRPITPPAIAAPDKPITARTDHPATVETPVLSISSYGFAQDAPRTLQVHLDLVDGSKALYQFRAGAPVTASAR